ncbi:beta-glucosidase [Ideonella sp. 4Y16]|uniref:Beta-glucosidase n=1 Tax=Ideonella alba TaxID=2824118 RepID=A0A941BGK3_9BURK|nr:GH1 family beta-glucosidase [Ideonella alba]MBQ0930633.1 beta-glucosidase [Ideonella alba]MBQ0944753.1 beta-glucosidase [Ideonella alba]
MSRTLTELPSFPPDFVWGVATSAFQIEGAAHEAGKGESIWDRFCRQPGAIADGSNGDIACDHIKRVDEDLDLIARLGVDAYRFSVSWPRVQPDGRGAFNEAGLAFYDRLVDGLLARGLRPYLTLNHWDLPQALQDGGGWAVRDTVHRFVDYARAVNARLGDRLAAVTTHNEPWVMAVLGHESGIFAPGIRHRGTAMQVAHHLLLSHGLALQALRADGCRSRLGIVLNLSPIGPATDSPEDRAAAWLEDGRLVRWYMDPLLLGRYPEDVWQHLGADAPRIEPGDLAAIATPMDYLGINYYTRGVVSASGGWSAQSSGLPLTDMGWEVVPEGLTELLLRLHRDWDLPPVYVMENGAAFRDELVDGQVMDTERRDYIARHIAATHQALAAGVPMAGYMVWSLMDNFEWASGYAKRFGIVHVDYATLARTPKQSYHWYRHFLQSQRAQRQQPQAA